MKIITIFLTLCLVSCASYMKRKECSATNWFDYGQNVALDGRRLSGDQFILECSKADAEVDDSALDRGFKSGLEKYCQPDMVYINGKNGKFFSTEMCTGQGLNLLQVKHSEGVASYCKVSNGYSAGAKGEAYNKICPSSMENNFLPEFNRGRKRYLSVLVLENQKQIGLINQEISTLKSNLKYKNNELQRHLYNTSAKDDKTQSVTNAIRNEVYSIESNLRQKENLKESLLNKNKDIQLELVRLDN